MFCVTMVGSPGRCLASIWAINRPDRSVPPPAGKPMIVVTVLPLNDTGSAVHAGEVAAANAARQIKSRRIPLISPDTDNSGPPWERMQYFGNPNNQSEGKPHGQSRVPVSVQQPPRAPARHCRI